MESIPTRQNFQQNLPEVLYIAGANRSGTTLLDILLSQHPAIFSGGELSRVPRNLQEMNMKCSCGLSAQQCHFWSKVKTDISELQNPKTTSHSTIKNLNKKLENRKKLSSFVKGQKPDNENLQLYIDVQTTIISRLWELKPEASFIVDSSKTEEGSACRPLALGNLLGLRLKIIHLIRDPRGVVASNLKGSNRELEQGKYDYRLLRGFKPLVTWLKANKFAEKIHECSPDIPVIKISYEELMTNPSRTFQNLGNFLSLDFSDVIRVIQDGPIQTPAHMIGGNRMRLGPIKLEIPKGPFHLPWYYRWPCLISKKIYY